MEYRIAKRSDFIQLAEMRYKLKTEFDGLTNLKHTKEEVISDCIKFFRKGTRAKTWIHWVAVDDNIIIANASLSITMKIPKPSNLNDKYGNITNVYCKPAYRNKGIGSELMQHLITWAKQNSFNCLTVWPRKEALSYYERLGFSNETDIMEMNL